MKTKPRMAAVGAAFALALAGSAAKAQEEPVDITMIIYASAGVPFFQPLEKGAMDAAKALGVNLDIQYAENDTATQNNIMQTALANGVDGLAVEIWDDNAFDQAVCDTIKAGTPVIGFNIDDSEGAAGNCRMAFVGQNFVEAGYAIGKRMIAEHGITKGDKVFTPVEYPEAAYAVLRHRGVQMALDEVGATADLVGVTDKLPEVLTAMTQYRCRSAGSTSRRKSWEASSRVQSPRRWTSSPTAKATTQWPNWPTTSATDFTRRIWRPEARA
jgi:simple sugar transport system substrate-binding protein